MDESYVHMQFASTTYTHTVNVLTLVDSNDMFNFEFESQDDNNTDYTLIEVLSIIKIWLLEVHPGSIRSH